MKCKKGFRDRGDRCVVMRGRVTVKNSSSRIGNLDFIRYDVNISGKKIDFSDSKVGAQIKANRIRHAQEKKSDPKLMNKIT